MVLLEFSIAPAGAGESMSAHVACVLDLIDRSGVPYRLTPMGTILEAKWQEVMGVATRCFELMQAELPRIGVQIKVDYRKGPAGRLEAKIESVEKRVGRKLGRVAGRLAR
jgi:uncharacterized protein (TIGR00106 family)